MNHYKNYGTEDLVWDTFFRQWVLSPTRETDNKWREWLSENPEMAETISQAKQIVLSLQVKEPEISNKEIADIVRETIARSNQISVEQNVDEGLKVIPFYKHSWLKVAASLTILILFGLLLKSRLDTNKRIAATNEIITSQGEKNLVEKINDTTVPMLVALEDGSKITLAPQSSIQFEKKFNGNKREIYLSGKAFFDVAKDPGKPFLVYTKTLVTKVLGTSFTISAYKTSRVVTVEVKTGRVSVFTQSDPDLRRKITDRELEGVVLSPNQKIIYSGDNVRMVKTLVEKPRIVIPKNQVPEFIFEDVPVSEVFDKIGKAYGIDILYDEDLLKGCPLTATLENQTLHDKLTIICKAIEASYEIVDGQIVIHSKGCKN